MDKTVGLKVLGIVLIVMVVANLVLFTFHRYDWKVFWGVMAIAAILAYVVLPKMKK